MKLKELFEELNYENLRDNINDFLESNRRGLLVLVPLRQIRSAHDLVGEIISSPTASNINLEIVNAQRRQRGGPLEMVTIERGFQSVADLDVATFRMNETDLSRDNSLSRCLVRALNERTFLSTPFKAKLIIIAGCKTDMIADIHPDMEVPLPDITIMQSILEHCRIVDCR